MDFNAFKREDEEEKLLEKCLFVDERHLENEEEEEEIPAATGEDYLRKVVREGRKFQGTLISDNAEELLKKNPERATHVDRQKSATGEKLLPSKEWQEEQVKDFTNVRLRITRHVALLNEKGEKTKVKFPKLKDEEGWADFCFGQGFYSTLEALEEGKNYEVKTNQGQAPLLHIISSLRQPEITRLVEYHAEWAETIGKIEVNQALWFYALMSVVEKPLHPDIISSMRSFVLLCSKQRGVENEIKHYLNLIICLVANYFGQSDLSD